MLEIVTQVVIVIAWVGGVLVLPLLLASILVGILLGRLQRRLRDESLGPAVPLQAERYWRLARVMVWPGWRPLLLALGWLQPVLLVWMVIGGPMLPAAAWLNRFIEAMPWAGSLPSAIAAFLSPFVWAIVWFVLSAMPERLTASLPIAGVLRDWIPSCGRCGSAIDFQREVLATCPVCGEPNLNPLQLSTTAVELPRSQARAAVDRIQGVVIGFAFTSGLMVLGVVLLLLTAGDG